MKLEELEDKGVHISSNHLSGQVIVFLVRCYRLVFKLRSIQGCVLSVELPFLASATMDFG
jgi:hypothetical protein